MQPRELQSISRLTTRVDSLSFISSLLEITLLISAAQKNLKISSPLIIKCDEPKSPFGFLIHRIRRFFVERSSEEGNPIPNNTPVVLNSTQLSGPMARETITISSVPSLEPRIVTIDLDLNEPTFRYGLQPKSNCATQPQGSQFVAQPFQRVGYFGRHSTRQRIQPPITGAV